MNAQLFSVNSTSSLHAALHLDHSLTDRVRPFVRNLKFIRHPNPPALKDDWYGLKFKLMSFYQSTLCLKFWICFTRLPVFERFQVENFWKLFNWPVELHVLTGARWIPSHKKVFLTIPLGSKGFPLEIAGQQDPVSHFHSTFNHLHTPHLDPTFMDERTFGQSERISCLWIMKLQIHPIWVKLRMPYYFPPRELVRNSKVVLHSEFSFAFANHNSLAAFVNRFHQIVSHKIIQINSKSFLGVAPLSGR